MNTIATVISNLESCSTERDYFMLRIIICDDDKLFLRNISDKIESVLQRNGISAKIHSYSRRDEIGLPILKSCDIAFLDIDFGDNRYTGLDIARSIRQYRNDSVIIFVSNYIEYAPEGYEVHAFRYMLKKDLNEKLAEYLLSAADCLKRTNRVLKIKTYGEIIDLLIAEIQYIESNKRMVSIHIQKGRETKIYTYYASISDLETELEMLGFLRIHKSFLINMNYIKKLQSNGVILTNGTTLRVSTRKYPELKRKYLLWKGL